MDLTNAERQRRYIARLKAQAGEPQSPDLILAALARLQPKHFPKGALVTFARQVIAEGERLLLVSNGRAPIAPEPVSNEPRVDTLKRLREEIRDLMASNKTWRLATGGDARAAIGERFLAAQKHIKDNAGRDKEKIKRQWKHWLGAVGLSNRLVRSFMQDGRNR